MKVKFAHISDVHLGAWRDERLNELGYNAFKKAVNNIIDEEVDFVIISGDLRKKTSYPTQFIFSQDYLKDKLLNIYNSLNYIPEMLYW